MADMSKSKWPLDKMALIKKAPGQNDPWSKQPLINMALNELHHN